MNTKAFKTLEFNKILERLEGCADSQEGKRLCRELRPSCEISEIRSLQEETAAAVNRIRLYGGISFSGVRDVSASIQRLSLAASLSIPELLQISGLLTAAGRAQAYGREDADEKIQRLLPRAVRLEQHYTKNKREGVPVDGQETEMDALSGYFRELAPLKTVNRELTRCILSEDELADDASEGLHQVRRRIHQLQEKIHTELSGILNRSRSLLQDGVITMRDGRYCLPVKAEYKASFPGMVHDQSATGATLFIEPMSVVRLNNEIRELESEEKREIEKVLRTLSDALLPYSAEILRDIRLLAQLDFSFAKAKLSHAMQATQPVFNDRFYIHIKDGRHPLIDPKRVVPISIYLGDTFELLIITGPNTGGKTVCLKTVGLFQLMGQSGLFIPAFEGSELGVFREIFADIGDEQSIEQSLSTFSAHMTNTVRILEQADAHSLCLFDELGAGTDPTEGAALAMAILNFLHNMKTRTIATTHYAEIKVYALSTEGVENASCEFDVETLSPTYRLLIGVPGKSNAFAISQKLGLPGYIIEDARARLASEDVRLEDVIASLEESRVTAEREREEIQRYRTEIEEYKRRARESSKGVEKGKDRILQKAREEAATILAEAKETADAIVKELRKQEQNGAATIEAEKTRTKLNQKLRATQAAMNTGVVKGPAQPLSAKNIRVGDMVRVLSMNLNATVSTLPDRDGMVYVTAGIIRTRVSIRELELVQHAKGGGTVPRNDAGRSRGAGAIRMSKAMGISPELNLIGKMTADALPELNKYLDDACLAHLPQVRIVHGRGTGALKKMVHTALKKNKYVESFRLGEYGEGSDGVTIAFFRK